jgi:hypothetical protein
VLKNSKHRSVLNELIVEKVTPAFGGGGGVREESEGGGRGGGGGGGSNTIMRYPQAQSDPMISRSFFSSRMKGHSLFPWCHTNLTSLLSFFYMKI